MRSYVRFQKQLKKNEDDLEVLDIQDVDDVDDVKRT